MGNEPRIAFGLRCLQSAMRAKSGQTAKHEGESLIKHQEGYVPGDESAERAARLFKEALEVSKPEAGAALHDWLLGWADELALKQIREVPATLAEQDPNWPEKDLSQEVADPPVLEADDQPNLPRFDWQDRADING